MEARYYLAYSDLGKDIITEFKTPKDALERACYPFFKNVSWYIFEEIEDGSGNVLSTKVIYSSETFEEQEHDVRIFISFVAMILFVIVIIFLLGLYL